MGLPPFPISDGVLDHLHLHCHYGQDLHSNAVELIEAAPGSRLHQTFIDVSYGLQGSGVLRVEQGVWSTYR